MANGTISILRTMKYIGDNPTGFNINDVDNPSGWGWMNYGQVSGDFPNNVGYGILVILRCDNNNIVQLYVNDQYLCYRQNAGSWSSWRRITV